MFISKKRHNNQVRELKAQIEQLSRGIIPQPKGGPTEIAFIDKKGRKYYRYIDPTTMPARRGIHSQLYNRLIHMNLSPELLEGFYAEIEGHFDKGNVVQGFKVFGNMIDRAKLPTEKELLLKLAAIHYIREDEEASDFSEEFASTKIADWESEPEALNFFLSQQYREIWNCGEQSDRLILDSLSKADGLLKSMRPKEKKSKFRGNLTESQPA